MIVIHPLFFVMALLLLGAIHGASVEEVAERSGHAIDGCICNGQINTLVYILP
jgi:hypothetical protein